MLCSPAVPVPPAPPLLRSGTSQAPSHRAAGVLHGCCRIAAACQVQTRTMLWGQLPSCSSSRIATRPCSPNGALLSPSLRTPCTPVALPMRQPPMMQACHQAKPTRMQQPAAHPAHSACGRNTQSSSSMVVMMEVTVVGLWLQQQGVVMLMTRCWQLGPKRSRQGRTSPLLQDMTVAHQTGKERKAQLSGSQASTLAHVGMTSPGGGVTMAVMFRPRCWWTLADLLCDPSTWLTKACRLAHLHKQDHTITPEGFVCSLPANGEHSPASPCQVFACQPVPVNPAAVWLQCQTKPHNRSAATPQAATPQGPCAGTRAIHSWQMALDCDSLLTPCAHFLAVLVPCVLRAACRLQRHWSGSSSSHQAAHLCCAPPAPAEQPTTPAPQAPACSAGPLTHGASHHSPDPYSSATSCSASSNSTGARGAAAKDCVCC